MAVVEFGPAPLDLNGIYAGDSNPLEVTLTVGDDPVDLTGATVTAQARKTKLDTEIALTALIVVTDDVGGVCIISWDGDEIRDLLIDCDKDTWQGVWDFQVDDQTLLGGKFKAQMDVTR